MTVNEEMYELLTDLEEFFQRHVDQLGTEDCFEADWAKAIRAVLDKATTIPQAR